MAKKKDKNGDEHIECKAAVDKNEAKWRKIDDYYKICKEEFPTAWTYFVAYLNLLADMVQGRNKTV